MSLQTERPTQSHRLRRHRKLSDPSSLSNLTSCDKTDIVVLVSSASSSSSFLPEFKPATWMGLTVPRSSNENGNFYCQPNLTTPPFHLPKAATGTAPTLCTMTISEQSGSGGFSGAAVPGGGDL